VDGFSSYAANQGLCTYIHVFLSPRAVYCLPMSDHFFLNRFIDAQDPVYERVWGEICEGHKQTHWMWFVFPQLAGIGDSDMSRTYGLSGIEEARAYLAHPILGERLVECTSQVNRLDERPISHVFSFPDDLKFHGSMTLFREASNGGSVFRQALDKYFDGAPHDITMRLLKAAH
jgi:uncharacterized protein (DUF1810 family)